MVFTLIQQALKNESIGRVALRMDALALEDMLCAESEDTKIVHNAESKDANTLGGTESGDEKGMFSNAQQVFSY